MAEREADAAAKKTVFKQRLREHRTNIRIAIIGMPNSGKTGIFNLLTGQKADVDVIYVVCEKLEGYIHVVP